MTLTKSTSGWTCVIAFLIYAIPAIARWESLDTWYRLFTLSALLGALFLGMSLALGPERKRLHWFALIFLLIGVAGPIDAIAFFLIMRIPIGWIDYFQFALPPAALTYYLLMLALSRYMSHQPKTSS
ncbi:MAG: hypothetical protein AAFY98_00610 [Verrucomicrobiota bacterium]